MNRISQTVPLQLDTPFSPFRAYELDCALDFLAKAGFTGVELAVAHPRAVDADALLRRLEPSKLPVTTLSTGQIYGLEGIFLSSLNEDVRARAVDTVKGHIELSARIGFPPVTIGLLRGKLERADRDSLLCNLRESMLICLEYGARYGAVLQLEPINRSETNLLNSTAEALAFLHDLGDPENAGILYDTYHSYMEDGDMEEAIRSAAGKITNVHIADSHRGLPGFGDIDFGPALKILKESGYSGAYALETLAIPDREFVKYHCYESILAIVE